MSKHTPGPWESHGECVFRLNNDGENRFWAHVQGGFLDGRQGRTSEGELRANARLIAAAPDLLAALVLARSWVATRLGDTHEDLQQIDAALKKARVE